MTLREKLEAQGWGVLGSSPIEIPGENRKTLAEFFAAQGYKKGVEVGVEEGKYSEVLLSMIPGLALACVDPWKAYPGYRSHLDQSYVDVLLARCRARLTPWLENGQATIVRQTSVEAAQLFEDGSLDFIYLDANHRLDHVVADLVAWTPKVRKGGIISGHDWIKMRDSVREPIHVQAAVRAFADCYRIDPWFVLGLKSEKRSERARSWFWVKA